MPWFSRLNHPSWAGWLGLAWVWSGVIWAFGALSLWSAGEPGNAGVMVLRLVVTVALGVGLCAGESWAWAWAVGQTALYLTLAGGIACASGGTWLLLPSSTLSWQPVFLGLAAQPTALLALGAVAVAGASGGALALLLQERAHFSIPHRRAFTLLVRSGLAPVLLTLAVDFYLLVQWWPLARR